MNKKLLYIIALTLLESTRIESSQLWHNATMCMTNQTMGLMPPIETDNGFAALDNTIGALALWCVPLGCNILRYKWNQRKIAEKIDMEPINKNIANYHVFSAYETLRVLNITVYDCLHQRQFNHTRKTDSFLMTPVTIMNDYVGSELDLHAPKRASHYFYFCLLRTQRQKEIGIPEISKIIGAYFWDQKNFEKQMDYDQDKAAYQPLLDYIPRPLTISSIPTILLQAIPIGIPMARGVYYATKFGKHMVYDGEIRMLLNGCKYGPGRLISMFGSPLSLGINFGIQRTAHKCLGMIENAIGEDAYLNIGRALCNTACIQACDLLLNYLVIQRVKSL